MKLLAKLGGHRFYRNGDYNSYINFYMDILEKEVTASTRHMARNTDMQFQSPGYGWQKNKKKKNTGNCNTLCVSQKSKNSRLTFMTDVPII